MLNLFVAQENDAHIMAQQAISIIFVLSDIAVII